MPDNKKFKLTANDLEIMKRLTWYYLTPKLLFEILPTFKSQKRLQSLVSLQVRLKKLYQKVSKR